MDEKRSESRVENRELPFQLCRAEVSFPEGNKAAARLVNVSGSGVRLMVSSDDCPSAAWHKGCRVGILFPLAGLNLSGVCIYAESFPRSVAVLGIVFDIPCEKMVLNAYLSEVMCEEAV